MLFLSMLLPVSESQIAFFILAFIPLILLLWSIVCLFYGIISNIIYTEETITGIGWSAKRRYNRFTGKTEGIYSYYTHERVFDGKRYDYNVKHGYPRGL